MATLFPESTYRLQFHAGFTFRDATAIVPYLHALGVTHVYASPYLKARPGSTHGYDVIDHCSLNPELGTQADYDAFCDELAKHGMRHILDTVPNHVGVATNDNVWWNDVLEHGPASKYAKYFDIAWRGSPREELHDKVLLPILGGQYGDVLEKGELKVVHEDGKFWVRYYDRRFPLSLESTRPLNVEGLESLNRNVDRLDALLNAQHYRLAYWRTASDEINYRRFFDINDLAALAQEHEAVFEATHALTFKLIEQGKVAGLRIDHPDGLYDPEQYFQRLQAKQKGLYVLVEKILAPGEPLPADWPVHGTSGYDFLNMVNGLFVDGRNERAFTRIYHEWTDDATEFEDLVYEKKKLILETSLASELQMLAHRLDRLAQTRRHSRDYTHRALRNALREVIACFPVYRSYVTARGVHVSDRVHVGTAIERATARNPKTEPAIYRFIGEAVLQRFATDEDRDGWLAFAGKFQQLTAPVTAKGIEDTAFYIFNRFVSLNEVGGEPTHFGVGPEKLHAYLADRLKHWPYAMSTLSTHDTKRSEDVRARLNVLSEMPEAWAGQVKRWGELNARHRTTVDGHDVPTPNEEYLIYQTLIGAWPLEPWAAEEYDAFVTRVQAYLVKAMREAKLHTSWTDPNEPHEAAVTNFIAAVLDDTRGGAFLADLRPLRQRVSDLGLMNSLAQTVVRLAAPGVPDTYQGSELWDFSLVDPDNRRPVDYAKRVQLLESLRVRELTARNELAPLARELLASKRDGRVKLFVTSQLLQLRRQHPGLFSAGEYVPLLAKGERAEHVFAFARRHEGRTAVVVVPRLVASLETPEAWGNTRLVIPGNLATAQLRNVFTGAESDSPEVSRMLADFPVAVFAGRVWR
jgi:(1->4)-alpha-D-glucan 1-alpha-D-glucosylmutase